MWSEGGNSEILPFSSTFGTKSAIGLYHPQNVAVFHLFSSKFGVLLFQYWLLAKFHQTPVQVMILQVDKNVSNSYLEASQGTLHWTYTDSPGCHQVAARDFQCQKFVLKIYKLLVFGEIWQPLVLKVTWIGSPMQVRSWDPGVLCCHAHPRCCPANTVRDSQSKLEKGPFLVCGWGMLPPTTPINPYLRENAWKKWTTFCIVNPFMHAFESPVWS